MIDYRNTQFMGICNVHETFVPFLDKMNDCAKKYSIKIIVNSSFRIDANVKGAIVTPATHSNHMVGHAIDVNLQQGKEFYDSKRLYSPLGEIRQFINECKAFGMRWGGDFGKPDPVHFDDGMNIKFPDEWNKLYKELHEKPL